MKQSEIKDLSIDDLKDNLFKYRKEYQDLKLLHAVTPLENPLRLRLLRRTVARLATQLNSKQ